MLLTDFVTVSLDFLLILLVNGQPAAECVPKVLVQDTSVELRHTYFYCHTPDDDLAFIAEPDNLMKYAEATLNTEGDQEITIQLGTP